jgi:hypothetical protein
MQDALLAEAAARLKALQAQFASAKQELIEAQQLKRS